MGLKNWPQAHQPYNKMIYQLKELMLKTTSFFLDLLNPDQLEQSIHDEEGRKGEEGEEDVFCRESSDKEVLKELVQETVRQAQQIKAILYIFVKPVEF